MDYLLFDKSKTHSRSLLAFFLVLVFSAVTLKASLYADDKENKKLLIEETKEIEPLSSPSGMRKETIKAERSTEDFKALALETEKEAGKNKKNIRITPVGAPAYSPELSLWFAFGGLFSFKADPENINLTRSAIPLIAGISINKSIFIDSSAALYLADDNIRIYNWIYGGHINDHYWGVGYDAGRNTKKGSTTTAYKRTTWKLSTNFLGKIRKHLYAGLNTDFNQTKASDVSQGMLNDPYFLALGTNILNIGLGTLIQWDSRDFPVNPYRGFFVSAQHVFYASYKGSTNAYRMMDVEYRHYVPLGSTKRILAWMLRTRHGFGLIPWAELSRLGSPFDLRGYYWGQYRGRTMVLALMEYRHRFRAKSPNRFGKRESRHGVVGWIGTGSVGDGYGDLSEWLPNGGVGYRFEIQPRLNVRFDVGLGYGSVAFYVKFLEAF